MDSIRQKKMAELIKNAVSNIIQKLNLYTYKGNLVTITNCTVTPDLLEARLFLSILKPETKKEIFEQFELKNKEIRLKLGAEIGKQVRRVPILHFMEDDSLDEVYKLENLFKKIKDEG